MTALGMEKETIIRLTTGGLLGTQSLHDLGLQTEMVINLILMGPLVTPLHMDMAMRLQHSVTVQHVFKQDMNLRGQF